MTFVGNSLRVLLFCFTVRCLSRNKTVLQRLQSVAASYVACDRPRKNSEGSGSKIDSFLNTLDHYFTLIAKLSVSGDLVADGVFKSASVDIIRSERGIFLYCAIA
jgi:hypothetical protein